MLRKKDAASLDPWIDDAKNSLIAFFVRRATEDKAAVRADIDSPWSNRQTEGQITKLNPTSPTRLDFCDFRRGFGG